MNAELQKQLSDMLAKLLLLVENATDAAVTQLPPLVEEVVLMGRVEATFGVLVGLCLALSGAWLLKRLKHVTEEGPMIGHVVGGMVLSFVGVVVALENTHDAFLAWVAPRLYVLTWLKDQL